MDAMPCEHLEKYLPRIDAGDMDVKLYPQQIYSDNISESNLDPSEQRLRYLERRRQEHTFRRVLKTYRLSQDATYILCDRFINNLSFSEIARLRGFTSAKTAAYFYRKVLKELKMKGIKVK